jgi:hypothetical protein
MDNILIKTTNPGKFKKILDNIDKNYTPFVYMSSNYCGQDGKHCIIIDSMGAREWHEFAIIGNKIFSDDDCVAYEYNDEIWLNKHTLSFQEVLKSLTDVENVEISDEFKEIYNIFESYKKNDTVVSDIQKQYIYNNIGGNNCISVGRQYRVNGYEYADLCICIVGGIIHRDARMDNPEDSEDPEDEDEEDEDEEDEDEEDEDEEDEEDDEEDEEDEGDVEDE